MNTTVAPVPGHVVLVGMMGVGKSSLAKRIGRSLRRPVLDTDSEIVNRTGRTIAEIFAEEGEAEFRDLEVAVLAELLARDEPSVIAAAGGIVLRPENRSALARAGTVVWLRAPVDVLLTRVTGGTHRPALAADPEGTLRSMERDRDALYAEVADVTVDTAQRFDDALAEILAVVAEREAVAP
ncbi:MAG: shikimate kinase [Actinobacteria bacterium]|nr:shikimate kinase [Actinomycetota bacterium]